MKIDHKKVEKLKSFNGVKLRGNETFDELLAIEKKNMLKGTIICKAKKCNNRKAMTDKKHKDMKETKSETNNNNKESNTIIEKKSFRFESLGEYSCFLGIK